MHLPDAALSTPVWAALNAVSLPALGLVTRRAQRGMEEGRLPLLGVMGAFVFAAQMINFPLGWGTSGHLVGGTLLACTLGPAAAAVVMAAVLVIQAFLFQDGGVLALGANLFNMALAGTVAGYLPYRLLSGTRWRRAGVFLGGVLSVLVTAGLTAGELAASGVELPGRLLLLPAGLVVVNALFEGAITLAVLGALERMDPNWVRRPEPARFSLAGLMVAALFLAGVGVMFASGLPDTLERLTGQVGVSTAAAMPAPFPDYEVAGVASPWLRKALPGLCGVAAIYGVCLLLGRLLRRVAPRSSNA